MNEVRCTSCAKLLFKSKKPHEACNESADIEIMCLKCKQIKKYKTK